MYLLRLVICIMVAFSGLYLFYPWTTPYYYSIYSYREIMVSYPIMTVITGIIGAILVPLFVHKILPRTRTRNVLNIGIITLFVLSIMAILWGPYRIINIPNTIILSMFFSGAAFLKYIFAVALPFSFVSALLEFIFGKKYAVIIPIKPYSQNNDKILIL